MDFLTAYFADRAYQEFNRDLRERNERYKAYKARKAVEAAQAPTPPPARPRVPEGKMERVSDGYVMTKGGRVMKLHQPTKPAQTPKRRRFF